MRRIVCQHLRPSYGLNRSYDKLFQNVCRCLNMYKAECLLKYARQGRLNFNSVVKHKHIQHFASPANFNKYQCVWNFKRTPFSTNKHCMSVQIMDEFSVTQRAVVFNVTMIEEDISYFYLSRKHNYLFKY